MRYLFLFVIIFLSFFRLNAQFSLTGNVLNERGERLSFATVFLENTLIASATDDKGNYLLKDIPVGQYNFKVSFIGYQSFEQSIFIDTNKIFNIILSGEIYNLDQIEIQANLVGDKGPFTNSNFNKKALQKENLGQDVPYILQWSPSMVVTSDGGTGIGYTGMRLRGSDQTRINVTINGVPLNDAESQNVFWVDLPDLIGSVNNVQIQRGVGTSTNGSGAFGGTVGINTSDMRINPYIDVSAGMGSFNTKKLSLNVGTGLLNRKYVIDGRISKIKSDGYVDRASADLNSLFFSAARVTEKSSLRINILSGKEETYQAWYGVPEAKINGDSQSLLTHYYNNLGSIYKNTQDSVNLFNSDQRYNYYNYPDQVDNYRQSHVQLIHSLAVNQKFKIKSTLFYTKGIGYFEEFKYDDKFQNYQLSNIFRANGDEITRADIVRRRWLNNDFIGLNNDIDFRFNKKWTFQTGISASYYQGMHFGNVIKLSITHPEFDKMKKYYNNRGKKSDIAAYFRVIHNISEKLSMHSDLQVRIVDYKISGVDNDLRNINVNYNGLFFNPKFGLSYVIKDKNLLYLSYAVAHKEPSRGDFIDNALSDLPVRENLQNLELGYRFTKSSRLNLESNFYYMKYRDQLVLTGELNDVGAPIRINVPHSYRLGWEASMTAELSGKWTMHTNLNLSKNKISSFTEVIPDYSDGFTKKIVDHQNTEISFSPAVVGAIQLLYKPVTGFELEISSKFVSLQYLDNTSDLNRYLPSYHFQNVRLAKDVKSKLWKTCKLTLMINNVLNRHYSTNGYSYTYIYGESITENFYYPQAGINILSGLNIGF